MLRQDSVPSDSAGPSLNLNEYMTTHDHYYSHHPASHSQPRIISFELLGRRWRFETDAGVFSRDRLDRGTRLLAESIAFPQSGRLLDWGYGYGVLGVVAAAQTRLEVCMVDANQRAVFLAERNASLNEVSNVQVLCSDGAAPFREGSFDMIVSNPPIRAGNRVIFGLIDDAPSKLREGGQLCLVVQTRQGAASVARRMATAFGNVQTLGRSGGYRVLRSARKRGDALE